jgi:anti-sigma B factor antagonist
MPSFPRYSQSVVVTDADGAAKQLVMTLSGDLDMGNASQLLDETMAMLSDAGRLEINIADLRFLDSSGLRAFMTIHAETQDRGIEFVLREPRSSTRRLLEIVGLTEVFINETDEAPR